MLRISSHPKHCQIRYAVSQDFLQFVWKALILNKTSSAHSVKDYRYTVSSRFSVELTASHYCRSGNAYRIPALSRTALIPAPEPKDEYHNSTTSKQFHLKRD
jgi:hypothetical protein